MKNESGIVNYFSIQIYHTIACETYFGYAFIYMFI